MSDRNINCSRCKTHLGTIRDAKLKKGMAHMCGDCNTALAALEMSHKMSQDKAYDHTDMFGDVFGDIFGDKKWKK